MSALLDPVALARVPELLDRVQRLEAQVRELSAELATRAEANDELSIDDAAALTGRHRDSLYKLVQRKRLPATRRSQALFVRRSDVVALGPKRTK